MIHEFNMSLLTFDGDGVRQWLSELNDAMLFAGLTRSTLPNQLDIDNITYPQLSGSDSGFRMLLPVIYDYDDGLGDKIRVSFEVGKYRSSGVTSTTAYDTYSVVRTTVGSVNPADNSTKSNPFVCIGWLGSVSSITSGSGSKVASDTAERYTRHMSLEKSFIITGSGMLCICLHPYYKQIRSDITTETPVHTHVFFAVERSHSGIQYTNSYLNVLSYTHVTTFSGNPNNTTPYLVTVVGNTSFSSTQNVLYPSDVITSNGSNVYNILKRSNTGAIESYFKNLFVCSPLVTGHANRITMNYNGQSTEVFSVANTSYTNSGGVALSPYNLLIRYS